MVIYTVNIKQAGYQYNQSTIKNINFTIRPYELVGMIGSNGAGKSTTIKAILGHLTYIEGNLTNLEDIRYSYIPEQPIFYQELTLWEHFEFINAVEKLDETNLLRAKEILKKFHLASRIHEFPGTFSKGMQQKSMIALALFTNPQLLIIDEPFMGLDPASTRLLLKILEDERKKGTAILMCTHILDTAQRICDSFVIIEKGTMKASGALEEVLAQCGVEDASLYSCISMEEESIE